MAPNPFSPSPPPAISVPTQLDVPSCENGVRLAPPRGAGKPYTTTCLLPAEQRLQWWVGIEHEREPIDWTVAPRCRPLGWLAAVLSNGDGVQKPATLPYN